MEISETVTIRNLPNDIARVEALMSSEYGRFVSANTDVNVREIRIVFIGGTPSKEITREMK